jgi:hypothetical protein
MPKFKSNDSGRGGDGDRQGDRKNNGRQRISKDDPQLDSGREVSDGNSLGCGSKSLEVSGAGTISKSGKLSAQQKDPLEARSVSLRRSQWQWLDELVVAHAMKSVSVFLREFIDRIKKEYEK